MKSLQTGPVIIYLMFGQDMADTHLLHLLDREQGTFITVIVIKRLSQ